MGALNQALVELWVFSNRYKLHAAQFRCVISRTRLRYLQGWFMFSPNPVMDDGTIVCDAVTVDGRRVDPLSSNLYPPYQLSAPNYDLPCNARSFQLQPDLERLLQPHAHGRQHVVPQTTQGVHLRASVAHGQPDDAVVKGVVYWVHDMNPRWSRRHGRSHESYGYNRKELFKFSNPDQAVQERWRELGSLDPPPAPVPEALPPASNTDKKDKVPDKPVKAAPLPKRDG